MQRNGVVMFVLGFACAGGGLAAGEFGPGWVRSKGGYEKHVDVVFTRGEAGNTSNARVPLERGEVALWETPEHGSVGVAVRRDGGFSVRTDPEGRPTEFYAGFGPIDYYDLDGDGTIDGFCDERTGTPLWFVVIEGRSVPVRNSKAGLRLRTAAGMDDVDYRFEGGRWQAGR